MAEQTKRGPGRPRTGRGTRAVTLTLSTEQADFLEKLPAGERSKYANSAIKEKREREEQQS